MGNVEKNFSMVCKDLVWCRNLAVGSSLCLGKSGVPPLGPSPGIPNPKALGLTLMKV